MLDGVAIRHVHHGYSPLAHRPREVTPAEHRYRADVAYVGNHSPYKERWLSALARNVPGIRMAIVGERWREASSGGILEPYVYGRELRSDFYARIVQTSKINVGIHSGPAGANGWEDLVSTRTFEIPACKGFMLHIDNDEINKLFNVGSEIDTFSDENTLCKKVEYYLSNGDQRAKMMERAYSRAVPAYSYYARAREILNEIERLWG
jgi:spore maturation protein CgeB